MKVENRNVLLKFAVNALYALILSKINSICNSSSVTVSKNIVFDLQKQISAALPIFQELRHLFVELELLRPLFSLQISN